MLSTHDDVLLPRSLSCVPNFWTAIHAAWQAYAMVRQQRKEYLALLRLSPRLIHDMGFKPEDVYEAFSGGWYELDPVVRRFHLYGEINGMS